ncbi:hypothetical protein ACFWA9_32550 [Kitasatospora sp. NPDC059973]|uniref:hypothetical protein n=1 Tax=Kitasatospora sp. NPDC059973 TaxID=3347020 RepID=UPI003677BF4C
MPPPDDRPLTESLDTFWQGRVPPPVAPADAGPEAAPAVDGLVASGITVRGRPLEALLAPAYRRFTDTG